MAGNTPLDMILDSFPRHEQALKISTRDFLLLLLCKKEKDKKQGIIISLIEAQFSKVGVPTPSPTLLGSIPTQYGA